MSTKLEAAIDAVRRLPPERQDELAEILALVAEPPARPYTEAELAAIEEGLADADRFFSDDQLKKTWTSILIVHSSSGQFM